MHCVVSQLNGYILGTGLTSQGGSDRNTLKQMLIDITATDCGDDLNLRGMQVELDRGYKKV